MSKHDARKRPLNTFEENQLGIIICFLGYCLMMFAGIFGSKWFGDTVGIIGSFAAVALTGYVCMQLKKMRVPVDD